jgi:2-keto-3-deoxy-L-rhamnonate aldolase RhmA
MHMSLSEKLRSGQRVYGTCFTSIAPSWPQSLKKAGLDFAFIDNEHISMNRADLARLSQMFVALGISPIVRIPSPDPYLASQAIDAGAVGVLAPYIEQKAQVLDLVGAVKYKPLKGERLQRHLEGVEKLDDVTLDYVQKVNRDRLAVVNIESVPAMNRLEELLSVPGLDAVFIGPHDLSVSLGVPEQYDHPVFEKAVATIIHTTRRLELSIGIHFSLEPERQVRWAKEGANIIVHSFDVALFTQRLIHDMGVIRQSLGDGASDSTAANLVV